MASGYPSMDEMSGRGEAFDREITDAKLFTAFAAGQPTSSMIWTSSSSR